MDSNLRPDRKRLLTHLHDLLKAGVGSVVVASATFAVLPAEASPSRSTTVSRPPLVERLAEIRKQVQSSAPATEATAGPVELAFWPNNGFHNWHNIAPFHNWGNLAPFLNWGNLAPWNNWSNWSNIAPWSDWSNVAPWSDWNNWGDWSNT